MVIAMNENRLPVNGAKFYICENCECGYKLTKTLEWTVVPDECPDCGCDLVEVVDEHKKNRRSDYRERHNLVKKTVEIRKDDWEWIRERCVGGSAIKDVVRRLISSFKADGN